MFWRKKNILIHYVNVAHVDEKDIPVYIDKVKDCCGKVPSGCYRYFIPSRIRETSIEVIHLK